MSDDRQDHEAKADELERELDKMQEQSDDLGGKIESAGEEWEQRKSDDKVPGATGELDEDEGGDEDGGTPDDAEELDFGRALAEDGDGGDEDDEEKG